MLQDLHYAVRMLRRSWAFTVVVTLTLALGIGANTAIFSLINVLILRPLPVRDPGRLVEFRRLYPADPPMNSFWLADYEHLRAGNDVLSDLVGSSRFTAPDPQGAEAGRPPLAGEYLLGEYFDALGLRPSIGRLLEPRDSQPGSPPAAVISWSYWSRVWNRSPAALGSADHDRRCSVHRGWRRAARVRRAAAGVPERRLGTGLCVARRRDLAVPSGGTPQTWRAHRACAGANTAAR